MVISNFYPAITGLGGWEWTGDLLICFHNCIGSGRRRRKYAIKEVGKGKKYTSEEKKIMRKINKTARYLLPRGY